MCQWMTSLNRRSKTNGSRPKNNVLSLKLCEGERVFYKFRLLGFSGPSDRDDPFIKRFMHQHWSKDAETGRWRLDDEVVCPVTPHVHVEGNRYNACKICDLAGKYFNNAKQSGYADKDSLRKSKEFSRKFQGIIPVYVVCDPNNPTNNGTFKVLMINDKKIYDSFRKTVEKASMTKQVFNGSNAHNCVIHVGEVPVVYHEGQSNEFKFMRKEIDRVAFEKEATDIPEITKEACDNMEFDETYYTSSSQEELNAFYAKYCTATAEDVVLDDDDMDVFETKAKPAAKPAMKMPDPTPVAQTKPQISTKEIDEMLDDDTMPFDESPESKPLTLKKETTADDIMSEIDDIVVA